MYYQRLELPGDNTACRAVPLCITQQVQTGRKCIQKAGGLVEGGRWDGRGLKSACVSLHKKYAFNIIRLQLRVASNNCFEIRTKIYFPFPKQ